TSEWWGSESEDHQRAVVQRYWTYLASVRDQLPAPLVELAETHTLHDSRVERIDCDFLKQTVDMRLHGWDRGFQYRVRHFLHFSNVSMFEQVPPQQEDVDLELELGDLGYWECEPFGSEVEVRMLFASGTEFRIRFSGFEFSYVDVGKAASRALR